MSSSYQILLTNIFITIFSVVTAGTPQRIVSGNHAAPGEFPYIVSLRFNFRDNKHICGGSIISPKHSLTAAHCVDWLYPRDIIVVSGTNRQDDKNALKKSLNLDGSMQDAIKLPTKSWIPHTIATVAGWGYKHALSSPDYSKDVPNDLSKLQVTIITHEECAKKRAQPFEYQICATRPNATICQLKDDLKLDGYLQDAIELPIKPYVPKRNAVVAGWGYTQALLDHDDDTDTSDDLNKLNVTIITHDECRETRLPPFEYQICATNPDGVVCQGDSGGPLVVDNILVGVLSTSSCLIGSTPAFMDVYYFKDFIEKAMNED
ncbi:chymotrypsin-like [Diachasma alloeum]|uniref:chymotrypsin-like n=1 Tax=Diachasma alloeum TaxID=454923 RepID=UPI0010FBB7BB|nr:chymotrypsin-like [Diachasma alloeum]